MDDPRVSILMPSHRSANVVQAIASVLGQTSAAYQLLVDHTPGAPLGERANRLARVATGEWLVMLSDDDWLTSVFVEVLLAAADRDRDADVVYSDYYVSEDDRLTPVPVRPWAPGNFGPGNLGTSTPCGVTALIRRGLWRQLGGVEAALGPVAWPDLYYRCFTAGAKGVHVPTPLWYHRAVHARQPELVSSA